MGDAYMMSLQQNEKLVVRGALVSLAAIPGYIGASTPIMPGADAPGYPVCTCRAVTRGWVTCTGAHFVFASEAKQSRWMGGEGKRNTPPEAPPRLPRHSVPRNDERRGDMSLNI